jgi:hypothetical protein
MEELKITITADPSPFLEAVQLLFKAPREIGNRFIRAVEAGAELARVDLDSLSTSRTGNLRVVLEPADFLLELVAASRTSESNGLIAEKV